jgi:hypothetical protein
MKTHRTIISIGAFLVAMTAALPVSALASPLLSGYGGPGQGNQAILGSALLNGPNGGRGGGSSGSSGSSGSNGSSVSNGSSGSGGSSRSETSSGAAPAKGSGGGSGGGSARGGSAASGNGKAGGRQGSGRREGGSQRGTGAAASSAASFYPASERVAAGQQGGALGLSAADLVYIILAVGTLAFMGVLTRRMTRTTAAARHR